MDVESPAPSGGFAEVDAFRGFMSFYFTGVSVVCAIDAGGHPHGLTCNSLSSVTISPPTLQIGLNLRSGTLAAVRDRGSFGVNLLHERAEHAARLFASPEPGRFERTPWRPSTHLGVPWLVDDAFAMAECRVARIVTIGDHAVVFGHVTHVECGPGAPLLYGRRAFTRLLGQEART